MADLRSPQLGQTLDQHVFINFEPRVMTASGEVEAEGKSSDSDYDSDVIVVGME
jgi:hypothetical protein